MLSTVRKGKERYTELYPKAMQLHKQGMNVKDIASKLGVSYSAVYAWIKQGRKPVSPVLVQFKQYLEKNGPTALVDIKHVIPKHNDFYHISQRRGMGIKRVVLDKRYADYRVWYYLAGQETALKNQLADLRKKYARVRKKLLKTLGA